MRFASIVLLLLSLTLTACFGPGKIDDTNVQKILYPQLLDMMETSGKNAPQIVDVRMPPAYKAGHIPNAINIPITEIKPKHPQLTDKRPIIVYSGSWSDGFSNSAAKKLILAGYDEDNVYDFRGGLDYWMKEGGEVVEH